MKLKKFLSIKGFTLTELFISIALGFIILGFTLNAYRSSIKLNNLLYTNLNEEAAILKLHLLAEKITKDMDRHRFFIYPLIHHPGEIRLPDGINTDSLRGEKLPHPDSTAISYLRAEPAEALLINQHSENIACPAFAKSHEMEKINLFLGLSNNAIIPVNPQLEFIPGSGCWSVNLKSALTITLHKDESELPFIRMLIPVYEDYTIYKSVKGDLRYLSFRFGEEIENQPLINLAGIDFTFKVNPGSEENYYALKLQVFKADKIKRKYLARAQLQRSDFRNFLYNLSL